MKARNLVALLAQSVEAHPERPALWDPQADGQYRMKTYQAFWQDVRAFASLLAELGMRPGDGVGMLAENRSWWPVADLAVMSLGGVVVPMDLHASALQWVSIVRHAALSGLIVQNAALLRRLAAAPETASTIRFVVLLEPTDEEQILTVQEKGWRVVTPEQLADLANAMPETAWEARWRTVRVDSLATVVYTSGTSGRPKGVCLTHGNLCANIEGITQYVRLTPADRTLSYLPLSHIFERTAGQFVPLACGASIAYARGVHEIAQDFVRMPPTILTTVPRLLEKICERIETEIAQLPAWKQRLFHNAIRWGTAARVEGRPVAKWRLQLYEAMVYRDIRKVFGGHLRMLIVGGAPLPTYVGRLFAASGIPVVEGYGLTETSPVVSVNLPGAPRLGTAGKVLANVQVKLAADGEVLVRGPSVSPGYLHDEAETRAAFTRDGWFKTGDIGEWVDGTYLRIKDRKKNLLVLSTGKKVVPAPIEAEMVRSPYIEQAVLVGHGRKFVSAIVVPNGAALAAWLAKQGQPNAQDVDKKALEALLLAEVRARTAQFADFEQPKKVLVADEPFTVENGLLTPTLKVRTQAVWERYARELDELYAGRPEG